MNATPAVLAVAAGEPVTLTPAELQTLLRNVWNAGYNAGRYELTGWLHQGAPGTAPLGASNPWG